MKSKAVTPSRVEVLSSSEDDMSDDEPRNMFLDGDELMKKEEKVEDKVKRRNDEAWRKEKQVERDARANVEKCEEFLEHAVKFIAREDITAACFSLRKGTTLLAKLRGELSDKETDMLEKLREKLRAVRFKEANILKKDGNSFFKKKKLDEATVCYEKAIEALHEEPHSKEEAALLAVLYSNVAQTYLTEKQFGRAEEMLRKAEKLKADDAKVLYRLGLCMVHKKNVQDAMEYALRAQRLVDDVAVQKLIRDIQAIPTISVVEGRVTALRVLAAGERVVHEPAIVHTVRHYDDKIDRNIVNFFFLDTCKALEKEAGGEEMDNAARLVVALVLEKKHEEYLQRYPATADDRQVYYGRWVQRLATKLAVSEETIQSLLGVVARSRIDFDSPHVGIRGAAVFSSAGHLVKTDDEAAVNASVVASPDAVTVVTLRPVKPGEPLVVLKPLPKRAGASLELAKAAEAFASMPQKEWLAALKAAVHEHVFSKGTPVVDSPASWPDLSGLTAMREQLRLQFAHDPFALSLLATCIVMGGGGAAVLEDSAEAEKLAQMWAAFPRAILQKEKNFAKPWLSTFFTVTTKFYKSVPVSFHGLVSRKINE
jgi:tetratricopeptide (TPR) repeat protein